MIRDLEASVLAILERHPEGLNEFSMFRELAASGFAEFEREVFADRMRMFRSHFVLFHVLYALRERLLLGRTGHLSIEALAIRLTPWGLVEGESSNTLSEHDPLRDYYLDANNLEAMNEDSLRAMLDGFWERFRSTDRRGEALRALGLDENAGWDEVKARHRELVFEHHPDRGGDSARLVEINAAMRILDVIRR